MGFDTRDNAKPYTPQEGDTLQAIAERETAAGNPITWQELARFNWGTDDETEVNAFLRDELGCRERDAANNFIISSADEPRGDLLIPVRFTLRNLALEKTYTLRLRKKEAPPQFLECCHLPGVSFAFNSSFIRPDVVGYLKKLEAVAGRHPKARVMIFGHTDAVDDDLYNKKLSERRSWSVYAFITNDPDAWEVLYNHPDEAWGLAVIQEILADLGHDPGAPDGDWGPQTRTAMRSFLGLPEAASVQNDAAFRKQLFAAYMTSKHDVDLPPERFMDPGYMGCGEFNPVVETDGSAEQNRRVTFFFFHPDRLPMLPCAFADMAPCQKQIYAPGPRFTDSFRCSFFDSLARRCPVEPDDPLPPPVPDEAPAPLIQFPTPDSAGLEGGVIITERVVIVKKKHTDPPRVQVLLRADKPFSGDAVFVCHNPAIAFFKSFTGTTPIKYDGTDNVFNAGELATHGVIVFAEGVKASGKMNDVKLTLTLRPGSSSPGKTTSARMTSVELTLDICEARTKRGVNPRVLSTADKFDVGRTVHVQDTGLHHGRAMLIVQQPKPAAFKGTLTLTPLFDAPAGSGPPTIRVEAFRTKHEVPKAGQTALPPLHRISTTKIPKGGLKLWAEGRLVSSRMRDTGFRLGLEGGPVEVDRIAMTVARLRDLEAVIPATPANTIRSVVLPGQTAAKSNQPADHQLTRGTGAAPTPTDYEVDFNLNDPLVLIENSGDFSHLTPVSLRVDAVPAGLPVSWSIQRDTRKTKGDHPDIVAQSPNPTPNLITNSTEPDSATLLQDAVGSFHIRPFVDTNGTGTWEGDDPDGRRIDREPFMILNLVLVRARGNLNLSRDNNSPPGIARIQPLPPSTAPAATRATGLFVDTGGTTDADAACVNDAFVDVIGGGSDGSRGLNAVFGGWINNVQHLDVVAEYVDRSVTPAVTHERAFAFTLDFVNLGFVFNPRSTARSTLRPEATATMIQPPFLDTSPFGDEGIGGNSAVGTEGVPAPGTGGPPPGPPGGIVKTPQSLGELWQIQMFDSPRAPCSANHGFHPGRLETFRMNEDFRADLCFWTNMRGVAAAGGTNDGPANRLYSRVYSNHWQIRFETGFNAAGALAPSVPLRVTMNLDPEATPLARPVIGSGLETRFPIALRALVIDART